VTRRVTRRDEFGLSSRQSLGLSVITIEWSTTKKLIDVIRMLKAVALKIFWRGVRYYNEKRASKREVGLKVLELSLRSEIVGFSLLCQKTFSLDMHPELKQSAVTNRPNS
jgi:hypothetical protein